MTIIDLKFPKCCQCGAKATRKLDLVEFDQPDKPSPGNSIIKHFCAEHFPEPLDDMQLRLLVDKRDGEIEVLKEALAQLLAYAEEGCPEGGYITILEARALLRGFRVLPQIEKSPQF